ncbi:MAG TPA: peptide-methionine (S)-S-oxide reductase MsrA [Bryobacteraceae bacterium]|nr:peptide-methionine (S)-S-oxide reductase MsrA [Bryobacteraceae bacterium]
MASSEQAVLGGGCFWCLEAVYEQMEGVISVESGYMGGHEPEPTYQDVCAGDTGHIEVVRITFDPGVTSYRDILEVFFAIHDPTTRDRQGNDTGVQYRSIIFYLSEEQRAAAEQTIAELSRARIWKDPIVTELRPVAAFYRAEDYHQHYFQNNPRQPYCSFVVAPKLKKFRDKFTAKVKKPA